MFKRLISCAAGLLIGIAPICVPVVNEITMSASAEEKRLDNGLEYKITDGEVTITDYDGSDVSVEIPAEIEGYPVTSIGSSAFIGCTNLTEINLPNSVTSIGKRAFYGCTNLTEINFPDSLTSIESEAFFKCQSITEINFPDSITRIGSRLFSGYGNKNDNIEKIVFEGDAPIIDSVCFDSVSTTVYYPGDNPTWTDSVLQDYSGDITWIPYYFIITQQPKNASAPFGSEVKTKVTAKGKDLSYQWYYCEANSDKFIKSKVTGSTYECPMTNESNGRKVYCEITDKAGNMVVSDTVTLSIS